MLTLVRHAATDWSGMRYCGRTDLPLSPVGRAQLGPLVAHLSTAVAGGATIVASPAQRCGETAAAIAAALGGKAGLDDRLREMDFGDVEGQTFAAVERRWPALASALLRDDARVDWPRGECWSDFANRVTAAWRDLCAGPHHTIVVSHGGPLRFMLRLALPGWPTSAPAHLGPAHAVHLVDAGGWSLRASWSPAAVSA